MATSLRDLRRKIKSVRSTQKITSAMQLMAAGRMQRAIRQATESRIYSGRLDSLTQTIAPTVDPSTQPLFAERPRKTALLVLVTSNRGLAGALNTQLIREWMRWRKEMSAKGIDTKVVAVGAKGRQYLLRYAKDQLLADFQMTEAVPTFADITPISKLILDEFLEGRADAVYLAYNHFVSTLRQEPTIVQYLPMTREASKKQEETEEQSTESTEIIFEPSRQEILEALLPRVLRVKLYQVFLEAHASEQSARMLAMKNATDNASNLIEDLTLTYNSARQAAITGELIDIAAGAAALENA